MKKYLQAFLGIVVAIILSVALLPAQAKATEPLTYGDFTYVISDGGVYITSYIGTSGILDIPNEIDGYTVTGIKDGAFKNNTTIKSVTIPEDMRTIGANAFVGCSALSEINFNAKNCTVAAPAYNHVGAFSNAGSAATELVVNFSSTVESIPSNMFSTYQRDNVPHACVTEVNIADGIESIGEYAFYACFNLESVTLGDDIYEIGPRAFSYCNDLETIEFNDTLNTIGNYAFHHSDSLKNVVFSESVTSIGDWAFAECNALETVNIGENVTKIGASAFYNCAKLSEVTIPKATNSIGRCAFQSTPRFSVLNFNAKNCTVAEPAYDHVGVFSGAGSNSASFVVNFGSTVENVPAHMFSTYQRDNVPAAYVTKVNIADGIENIGTYAFYACFNLEEVVFGADVYAIEAHAFSYCNDLETVEFNEGLETIGNYAFHHIDSLETITFGSTVHSLGEWAFAECASLKKVNIGDAVTSIGTAAFYNCPKLSEVSIPKATTYIGRCAFQSTPKLSVLNFDAKNCTVAEPAWDHVGVFSGAGSSSTSFVVNFGSNVENIPAHMFSTYQRDNVPYAYVTEVNIKNGVKNIGRYAFYACFDMEKVTFGNDVETIGEYAFVNCDDLETVEFNNELTAIGNYAFHHCDSLEGILFGENVNTIGEWAFAECANLKEAHLNDNVFTIGARAFYNCAKLSEVTIPESTTYIYNSAFQSTPKLTLINFNAKNCTVAAPAWDHSGVFSGAGSNSDGLKVVFGSTVEHVPASIFDRHSDYDYAHVTEVVISDSVQTIGQYAFTQCRDLETLTLGKNLETIGHYAFYNCNSLEKVVFPNKLTTIYGHAFALCSKLANITWGSNLTWIDEYAFESCTSITDLAFNNKLSKIGYGAFLNCSGVKTITIPETVLEIHGKAFMGTSSLEKINFNAKLCNVAGVQYNNPGVFAGAGLNTDKLEVVFGSKVTAVPAQLFNTDGNTYAHVTHVTVPSNVKTVGDYAFAQCKDLVAISFKAPVVTVGRDIFGSSSTSAVVTCYYGSGLKEAATAAGCKYTYITPAKPTVSKVENTDKGTKVTWKKVTGAQGYLILRKTGSGKYTQVGKVGASTTTFVDTKASAGKTYTYTVQAYAGTKKSTYNTTGLTIKRMKTAAISSVANGSGKITIKWGKVAGATKYMIYRSKNGSKYTLLKTVTGTSYTDKKSLTNGAKYSYKIVACDSKYKAATSAVKTTYYLSKNSITSKKSASKGALTLKWKKNTKASGYQIMYSTSSSMKSPKYVKVSGSKNVSKTIKSLKSKKTYYICIRTYKVVGGKTYYSEWSTKTKIKIK